MIKGAVLDDFQNVFKEFVDIEKYKSNDRDFYKALFNSI